jgi:hypothetical protein
MVQPFPFPFAMNDSNQVFGCLPTTVGEVPKLVLAVIDILLSVYTLVVSSKQQQENIAQGGAVSLIERSRRGCNSGEPAEKRG